MFFDLFDIQTTRIVIGSNIIHYEKGFIHPNRTLNYHDMIWYVNGECELFIDDVPYQIKSGDVVVAPAGRHHYSNGRSSANTTICYIHFYQAPNDSLTVWSSDKAKDYYHHYSIDKIEAVPNTVLLPTVIHTANNEIIHNLFKKITFCSCSTLTNERFETFFTMNRLLMALQYCYINGNTPVDNIVSKIIYEISTSRNYNISLEKAASQVNVSPTTLARRFRYVTGMSFHKYFMKTRMDMARTMLLTPQCTIKEISNALGFYDEFHFSKAFKQFYGIAPTAYRNAIENSEIETQFTDIEI